MVVFSGLVETCLSLQEFLQVISGLTTLIQVSCTIISGLTTLIRVSTTIISGLTTLIRESTTNIFGTGMIYIGNERVLFTFSGFKLLS